MTSQSQVQVIPLEAVLFFLSLSLFLTRSKLSLLSLLRSHQISPQLIDVLLCCPQFSSLCKRWYSAPEDSLALNPMWKCVFRGDTWGFLQNLPFPATALTTFLAASLACLAG